MSRIVVQINSLEQKISELTDESLLAFTQELRDRHAAGETLEALLPEAFAAVREAARRTLGQRHFDVQLMGGIALHEGSIAEMRTGEGKTLVATLAAYLNALPAEGVHVVTVNDYLAARDADWMGPVYRALGMTVGVVASNLAPQTKPSAYAADITYGTNNEFGFDYLRDNMALSVREKAQRGLYYGIIDEVDSILIDEARTPLIISGPVESDPGLYKTIDRLVKGLERHYPPEDELIIDRQMLTDEEIENQGHYVLDEKQRQIELTEKGHMIMEKRLMQAGVLQADEDLYSTSNLALLHHVQAALRAHVLFKRDVDYIVDDGQIVIVDEHTGRKMPGRRWSESLHQAVEAKENVAIQRETQTLASTTFQNYFRMYTKLSGMTGTADTEAFEFRQIYSLNVVIIPTNQPMIRKDMNDLVYMTEAEKYEAIIADVRERVAEGRPVLVGTTSVDSSERLSATLHDVSLRHNVLNAKYHESEAEIIAQAGQPGAVTIATNMAGRGTDIVLGGNLEAELFAMEDPSEEQIATAKAAWQERHERVKVAGGLHIIGTERHESRRIDNQLRGRAGRQGDPGSSRFYLSMEDQLMRLFVAGRMQTIMQSIGMDEGGAIEHRLLSRAIEKAQRKVEGRNFDIRKNLLEYDDVANDQRRLIYKQRDELMLATDISDTVAGMRAQALDDLISAYIPPKSLYEQWDVPRLEAALLTEFNSRQPLATWLEDAELSEEGLRQKIAAQIEDEYRQKEALAGAERMREIERIVALLKLDFLWKEHLATMDHLRQGIHLRAYAQKQPKQEYKRESFALFQDLLANISRQTVLTLSHGEFRAEEELPAPQRNAASDLQLHRSEAESQDQQSGKAPRRLSRHGREAPNLATAPLIRGNPKIGRNDPCFCGSGRKYKHCCLHKR